MTVQRQAHNVAALPAAALELVGQAADEEPAEPPQRAGVEIAGQVGIGQAGGIERRAAVSDLDDEALGVGLTGQRRFARVLRVGMPADVYENLFEGQRQPLGAGRLDPVVCGAGSEALLEGRQARSG